MRVELLAATSPQATMYEVGERLGWEPTGSVESMSEELLEFAGRNCYQSWGKPNPATADTENYVLNMLRQNHLSVIEHASATFLIEDVSRTLTHELVRHRHFSFSQLSQRYVDMTGVTPVIPPLAEENVGVVQFIEDAFHDAVRKYEKLYDRLAVDYPGTPRKQLREAARCLLPNCTPTKIVVTGNFRSWLEFLDKRLSPAADKEIRNLAYEIEGLLIRVAPTVFGSRVDPAAAQSSPVHVEAEYPDGVPTP